MQQNIDNYDDSTQEFKCKECGEKCDVSEETFDYPGTHCTHGQGGTHHTGIYISTCCSADYEEIRNKMKE